MQTFYPPLPRRQGHSIQNEEYASITQRHNLSSSAASGAGLGAGISTASALQKKGRRCGAASASAFALAAATPTEDPAAREVSAARLARTARVVGEPLETTWQEKLVAYGIGDSHQLVAFIEERQMQFSPLSLATALHRIATVGAQAAEKRCAALLGKVAVTLHSKPEAFRAQSLANMSWAVAKLQWPCEKLLNSLATASSQRLVCFKSAELAMLLWGFASSPSATKALRSTVLEDVAAELLRRGTAAFDAQSLATIAYAAGTISLSDSHPLWAALGVGSETRVDEFSDRQVANLVWAFATAAVAEGASLFTSVEEKVAVAHLAPIDLSLVSWAMAKLSRGGSDFYAKVAAAVVDKEQAWHTTDSRNVATLIYAFALAGHASENDDAFQMLGSTILTRADEFEVQGLTNVAWGYATAACANRPVFTAVATEVAHRPQTEFEPLDVANCLWAFAAVAHVENAAFIDRLREVGTATLHEFSAQNLAISLWSLAVLEVRDEALFERAADCFVQRLDECKSQELNNTLWACATTSIRLPWLFLKSSARATNIGLHTFKTHELSIMMWAHGMAGIINHEFFDAVIEEIVANRGINACSSREVSNTAWAYSTIVGRHNTPWLVAVSAFSEQHITEFDMQCIGNVLWAFATVGVSSAPLFEAACKEMTRRCYDLPAEVSPNIAQVLSAVQSAGFVDVSFFEAAANCLLRFGSNAGTRELIVLCNVLLPIRTQLTIWPAPERALRDRVVVPLLDALPRRTDRSVEGHARTAVLTNDHMDVWAKFEACQDALDVDHLGFFYTARLLLESGLVSDVALLGPGAEHVASSGVNLAWSERAAAICAEERGRIARECAVAAAECGAEHARKISRQLDKVNKRDIVAWVSFDVILRVSDAPPEQLRECGRTYAWSPELEEDVRLHGNTHCAAPWLRSLITKSRQSAILVGIHDRSGHAERVALLDVASKWLDHASSPQQQVRTPTDQAVLEVEGSLYLYVTHYPCISCVGVIAQFARLFPGVELHVGFVDGRAAACRTLDSLRASNRLL